MQISNYKTDQNNRYPALNTLLTIMNISGYGILLLGISTSVYLNNSEILKPFAFVCLIVGVILSILILASAQLIIVFLDIEFNTRKTLDEIKQNKNTENSNPEIKQNKNTKNSNPKDLNDLDLEVEKSLKKNYDNNSLH